MPLLESNAADDAVVLFVIVPVVVGVSVSVIVSVPPEASVAIEQVIGPVPLHEVPAVDDTETSVPFVNVSDTLTLVALDGPLFVTLIVNVEF